MIDKRNISDKRGFTLVEIMVAMLIFMIVVGMVYTIFSGTMNYWKRGYSLASRQQSARNLISRMTSNISSLFVSVSRDIYCFGSKDKFYFISASRSGPQGNLAELGYEYSAADKTILFSYQEKADFDFDTYDSQSIIAVNVLGLDFSYLNKQGSWVESWDSRAGGQQEKTPPESIKISFAIENTDLEDDKEVFETIVELPIRSKYQ